MAHNPSLPRIPRLLLVIIERRAYLMPVLGSLQRRESLMVSTVARPRATCNICHLITANLLQELCMMVVLYLIHVSAKLPELNRYDRFSHRTLNAF